MSQTVFRFERPDNLEILQQSKLSVAVVISCRGGQDKLDLTLASLAVQSYPAKLVNVYIVDDGSEPPLKLPKIRPAKVKLINYKNDPKKWGKTKATMRLPHHLKKMCSGLQMPTWSLMKIIQRTT